MPATSRLPSVRIGAVVAIGIAAGLGLWLGLRDTGGNSSAQKAPNVVPVTATGLQTLVAALHRPIYWAGAQAGKTYELTQAANGDVYLRYLPRGAEIGTKQPYLTVGTYPVANALGLIASGASRPGSVRVPIDGGTAYYSTKDPNSVYLAFPGANYEIEVFSPSAAEALSLVKAGRVVAVAAAARVSKAALMSPAQLAAETKTAGHPVYWAGTKTGTSYELSEGSDRTFVRYLPSGAKAGTNVPALTVGTYVVPNAFSVTRQQARKPDAVEVPVTGGGIAFYGKSSPTSVYVAYPGQNVQIEVYDPAGHAASLVSSGKIVPVR